MSLDSTISYCGFSHSGPDHDNEDRVLPPFTLGEVTWCAIADGIGGKKGGAEAATIAINGVKEFAPEARSDSWAREMFQHVQSLLKNAAASRPELAKMGTTLSVIKIGAGRAQVAHVGDTRIYHLRASGLVTRTKDQTEVQRLLDEGILTARSAQKYPRRNVLLSALTVHKEFDLYTSEFDVASDDRFILLTDGAYESIKKCNLSAFSVAEKDINKLCERIEEAIFAVNPKDDYTCAFVEVRKR